MDIRKVMLVVDDSKTNRAVLKGIFSDSYNVLEAENGQVAIEILEKNPVAVMVLDISMPIMDGFEVLRQMKAKGMLTYVPVVVNSAFGQDENELKALELGASDFIRKPYNNAIVKRRVENVQSVVLYETTRSKRKKDLERMERMRFLMERDHLTGIYNRDSFIQKTTELMETIDVEDYLLVSIDIHQFKVINDVFGSKVGDSVLCRLAGAIARRMDREDCVYGREGGDHFMIFYPQSIISPEELLADLEKGLALDTMGSYQVRLKVGVYTVGSHHLPVGKMIDASQIALYTKGDSILGEPNYFNDTMRDQLMDEQELVAQMQQALDEHEFKVYFQPVFDAREKKPV
ncbi:MAG: response regulator, partial [Lachnospiraceae bacterium]|nr:response regulator [Lachnospiraceae bacterium]